MNLEFLKSKSFITGCLLGAIVSLTSLSLEPSWKAIGLSQYDFPRYLMVFVYIFTPRGCSEYWGTCSPMQIKIIEILMIVTHLLSWMMVGGVLVSGLMVLKRKLKA